MSRQRIVNPSEHVEWRYIRREWVGNKIMVDVAQLEEHLVVVQKVVGSNPIIHPK